MELKLSNKQEKKYINKNYFNKIKMLSKQMKELLKRGKNRQAIRICEEFEKENPKINIYENEYIVSQLMSAYNRQAKKEKLNKNILC